MEMEHGRNQHLRTLAHTLGIGNRQACHFTYAHRDITTGKFRQEGTRRKLRHQPLAYKSKNPARVRTRFSWSRLELTWDVPLTKGRLPAREESVSSVHNWTAMSDLRRGATNIGATVKATVIYEDAGQELVRGMGTWVGEVAGMAYFVSTTPRGSTPTPGTSLRGPASNVSHAARSTGKIATKSRRNQAIFSANFIQKTWNSFASFRENHRELPCEKSSLLFSFSFWCPPEVCPRSKRSHNKISSRSLREKSRSR